MQYNTKMNYYLNVSQQYSELLITEINDGKKQRYKLPYRPYLFVPDKNGQFKTLQNKRVGKFYFDSISEAYEWRTSQRLPFWGLTHWPYLWIYDNYPGQISYDVNDISIVSIDIETKSDDGFPDIDTANKEHSNQALDDVEHYGTLPNFYHHLCLPELRSESFEIVRHL